MSRPEHIAPPEFFYNAEESAKYGGNSRMIRIQTQMTERALELAKVEPNSGKCVLDVGCGSGISGEVLSEHGHYWVGMDISPHMLLVALERETEGDLMLQDMGQGFRFRPGSFDAAISISAVQWLCNRDKTCNKPFQRCFRFFQSLFNCLNRGARAVLQFYPEGPDQIEMLTSAAMKAGFTGGVVVDFPHSAKAKKYFMVLNAGAQIKQEELSKLGLKGNPIEDDDAFFMDEDGQTAVGGGGNEDGTSFSGEGSEDGNGEERETIKVEGRGGGKENKQLRKKHLRKKGKAAVKSKEWVVKKKDQMRARGREIKNDSKFTARKRKPRF